MNTSFKQTYIGVKLRKLKHIVTFRRKNSKTKSQIKTEVDICKRFWGIYPLHYFRYDLYKKSVQLTKNELVNYIPEFTHLGWDIALAKQGPVAIETNLEFGLDLYQLALGGLREAFKINDPNKYLKR